MSTPSDAASYLNPDLRAMPSMRRYKVDSSLHRLQWNESPFDFPADLKEEVLQRLARTPWSRYPLGFRAYDLIDTIARTIGLDSSQVVVGNGSSDILRIAIQAALRPGDRLVTIAPTFGAYHHQAQIQGAQVHEVPLDPAADFALPVDDILERARTVNARLIVICAPNNPTGTVYPLAQIRRIVHESQTLVIVDEAYAEFADQNFLPLLDEADNVILVHTLSKAYALAGVRVGYACAPAPICAELQKLVNTFTLSPFSEIAATVALENMARFRPQIEAVVAERTRLAQALAALPGVKVHSSGTNFLLVNIGSSADAAHAALLAGQQVLVTNMTMYPGYDQYLRISIGTPEENDLVITGLREHLLAAQPSNSAPQSTTTSRPA